MSRAAFLLGAAGALAGCTSLRGAFYQDVTEIKLDRDQFILFGRILKLGYDFARPVVLDLRARGQLSDAQWLEAQRVEAELRGIWVQFLAVEQGAPASRFDTVKALELVGTLVGMAI